MRNAALVAWPVATLACHLIGTAPALPPVSECVRLDAGDNTPASIRTRVELMVPPDVAARFVDARKTLPGGAFDDVTLKRRAAAVQGGQAEYAGYCRLTGATTSPTATRPTLADAAVLLDAGVPPVLGALVSGWVPTINWTLHFKHRPRSVQARQPATSSLPPASASTSSSGNAGLQSSYSYMPQRTPAPLMFRLRTSTVRSLFLLFCSGKMLTRGH